MKTLLKKPTILWADDDTDDLELFRDALHSIGQSFDLVEAHNGLEALDHLKEAERTGHLPCLIVLDMNMPVLNGKDTLCYIKRNNSYSKIPLVVFTTSNSPKDKLFCNSHGVEMITKPMSYEELCKTLSRLLHICNPTNN